MYKVIIVDDEPMIRFGLSSCVAWEEEGFEYIGDAPNGQAALEIIKNQSVDIVVTDIKMPVMDGLELTRRAKESNPHIKVILISSYSDFEYAREAVQLGVVVNYLLKPTMEPEDLLRILKDCRNKLDEYKRSEVEQQKSKFYHLKDQLKKMLQGEGIHLDWFPTWMREPIVVTVWKRDDVHQEAQGSSFEMARNYVDPWNEHAISFFLEPNQMIVIAADQQGVSVKRMIEYHRQLKEKHELHFSIGISPSVHQIKAIPDAYTWALAALDQSFFTGTGQCYVGTISSKPNHNPKEKERENPIWINQREALSQSLAEGKKEEGEAVLEQCFLTWKQRQLSREAILLQAESLLVMIISQNYQFHLEDHMKEMLLKLQHVKTISTLEQLISFMKQQFEHAWNLIPVGYPTEDFGGAHAMQLSLSYIQNHYLQDISLQEVAEHVHMSKNYFSEQFKRRIGLNFIDFVIRLRISHAKHLLATTSLKIYDIGHQAGFNSAKHFLKMFKREVQCTPLEYRQQQLKEKPERSEA